MPNGAAAEPSRSGQVNLPSFKCPERDRLQSRDGPRERPQHAALRAAAPMRPTASEPKAASGGRIYGVYGFRVRTRICLGVGLRQPRFPRSKCLVSKDLRVAVLFLGVLDGFRVTSLRLKARRPGF